MCHIFICSSVDDHSYLIAVVRTPNTMLIRSPSIFSKVSLETGFFSMGKSCIPWSEDTGETVTQLCLTLCDHMDCSPPGSSVNEILQARVLEWVAIPFSTGSSWPRDQTWVSQIAGRFFTLWATKEVVVKESACSAGDPGLILSQEDPLEKGMATHSSRKFNGYF